MLFRVVEHLKDEFYFTEAVMFTTSDNSWGPTEISYLENKFTNLAIRTGRYTVKNGNEPNPGNVTEEKEAELEVYIEQFKLMLGILGYKIFVPLVKTPEPVEEDREDRELMLTLTRKITRSHKVIEAYCKQTDEGFVVLAGSQIEETDAVSIPDTIKKLRARCRQNNEIKDGVLTKNYLFKILLEMKFRKMAKKLFKTDWMKPMVRFPLLRKNMTKPATRSKQRFTSHTKMKPEPTIEPALLSKISKETKRNDRIRTFCGRTDKDTRAELRYCGIESNSKCIRFFCGVFRNC